LKILRRITLPLALLVLTTAVYWPGLKGPFLFDDFSNLALLTNAGRLDHPDNVVRYLLSGFAGPTGRPLAMASFIPEADHWPDDPRPFKRTNLILHLLNTLLLAAVTRRVLRARGTPEGEALTTAWLAAGIWGLHPLWVSTTLYVVQRMTLLATLFVLLGLALHLHGRERLLQGRTRHGLLFMGAGLYGMGLLATLSKETGALLPLLTLVLERYALAPYQPLSPRGRRWVLLLAGLPTLAVLAYLFSFLPALFAGDTGTRDFTPAERLLTEGRVVFGYLGQLFLPRPEGGGLYGQEVVLSRGLFTPWTTAAAWAGIAALWMIAERLRRHRLAVSAAIAFFLAGHLLESTWLPLEPAFEHRNYLPALFLFLPLAQALASIPASRWRRLTVALVLGGLAMVTLMRADLWGRPFAQALTWARQHPDSPRAQAHLASLWLATGNVEEASRVLDEALRHRPNDLLLALNRLFAACAQAAGSHHTHIVVAAIRASPIRNRVTQYQISRVLEHLRDGQCGPDSAALFQTLWQATWEKAAGDVPFRAVLLQERALFHLARQQPAQALRDFEAALSLDPRPDVQLAGAAMLASRRAFREALILLDRPLPVSAGHGFDIHAVREWWLAWTKYWENERAHLRQRIVADWEAVALPGDTGSVNVEAQ
jgi:tetratricopeptide (TPR) repeat protein